MSSGGGTISGGADGAALAAACGDLRERARRAVAWVAHDDNADTVGLARADVDKRLRRMAVEAGKLEAAVERPMCVGVFGPSQAGKSYLVSVLARPGAEPLMIRFGGGEPARDYIRDINPGGERESTGVVTRFTVREAPAPAGFPVRLRLLSEIDVAKVLVNSYCHDIERKGVEPIADDAVRAVLERAQASAAGRGGGPRAEAVWDLQAYFESVFEGTVLRERLAAFWDEAAGLAAGLDVAGRAALFAPAWGGIPQLTELYETLVEALEALGHPATAHCPIAALVPRSDSIIDVATLQRLGEPDQPTLRVRGDTAGGAGGDAGAGGVERDLPLAVVTALTAELHLTIEREPWPFFATTDLLDFPGARSRQPKTVEARFGDASADADGEEAEERNPLAQLFLRGKVAYLFERYVTEQELTAMLLCVAPGPLEVVDLPRVVGDWIARTHGATPAERARATTVLFFVLTMFDRHFGAKAGENTDEPGERFAARLQASLLERFDEGWTGTWTPGTPFRNCHWLRNPNYPADAIIEYDGPREVRLRPDREDYVARLRAGYAETPEVRAHFHEPERAFDEALALNDGGVSYLAERLEPVCHPALKRDQIAVRRDALAGQLHRLLAPFHVSSDVETRLAERRLVSRTLLERLMQLYMEDRYTRVLERLFVSPHALWGLLYDARPAPAQEDRDPPSTAARPVAPPSAASAMPFALPGGPIPLLGEPAAGAGAGTPAANGAAAPVSARRSALARAAVSHWLAHLRAEAEEGPLVALMGGVELAGELVDELSRAARRTRLDDRVGRAIERLAGTVEEDLDAILEKATLAATTEINRFVTRFDYEAMALEDRPLAPVANGEGGDGTAPVFQRSVPIAGRARDLDHARHDHRREEFAHWTYAFHDLVERNAMSVDGEAVNVEQNAALGALIAGLDAQAGAAR